MSPVKSSLRHPQVVYVLTAVVFLVGIQALWKMPRREDPKVSTRIALVLAAYPGATAEQVEGQVTRRIEENLFRFAEVKRRKTYSTSLPGAVVVRVEVEDWVENPEAFWSKLRHDLNELRFLELPQGVLGPIVNSEFGDVSAMLLAVQGERYGYRELESYLDRIDAELRTIPSVSKIRQIGEQDEQIYVTSTMERLSQYGITPLQVIAGLQQQNAINEAGAFETDRARVPLRTTGLYRAEDQIDRQIVGVSPRTGQPIYLGDFATVERRYEEPESLVRVNGSPALMLALEMHEGNNIVDFGREIEARLERLRAELPPDLEIVTVADQPRVVEHRVGHFLREFGIAILAVIAVTMLLLPLRVAAIAATAIPVTVAVTFGAMQGLGIELHQVSLAGLIVVLGMVVDDAIVIADNYVELLDQGIPPEAAAARSATDLAVPVLTATLTIIASFLPLAFLPGSTGEFIWSLPVTVAVALGCSYIVAMLLTPLLCRAFIKEGLKGKAARKKSRFNPLDLMQAGYDRMITRAMRHRRLTMAGGVAAVLAGVLLFGLVKQRFFPTAERDQFAITVWLPAGTSLDGTDRVMRRVEQALEAEPEVVSYAAFVGDGAPRFYYSFDPPFPASNLGQFIVNTTSLEATVELVSRLREQMPSLAPAAEIEVQELQQGEPVEAPVEVRIAGPDLAQLKVLGARVAGLIESTPGSDLVHTNFREDVYALQVAINPEMANRLGLTSTGIAQILAGSSLGVPVSTFWEGSRALDIVLRLDESRRESFDHIRNMYLVSPVTGARVPLREVAQLQPTWQSSRIVRRNGIRTLTVGSGTVEGVLPSELLAAIKPIVDTLSLPPGYRIAWGGEIETQTETFGHMMVALLISLVSIFLILLFQFRRVSDVLLVMVSIPLSLFGALLGLVLTQNPFGFTAFLGVISLSGVVVRNAIILLEYIHERRAARATVEEAALEAGKRRLRPIFLTTAAAAVGVTPMILSGSALWAPLGSVIAVGLICSMVLTLMVVPVLYVLVNRNAPAVGHLPLQGTIIKRATTTALFLFALVPVAASAQEPVRGLALGEAIQLAREQNVGLQALRHKVEEARRRSAVARANYFPQLKTQLNFLQSTAAQGIVIPRGSLGALPQLGPFPPANIDIAQGGAGLFYTTTTLTQPVTQIFEIRQGHAIAEAETRAALAELWRAENEVTLGALQAYAGLLVAQREREVARQRLAALEEQVTYRQAAVDAGSTLDIAAAETRVRLLEARQELLAAEDGMDDIMYDMVDLLGLPPGTRIELQEPEATDLEVRPLEEYVAAALEGNPDILEARAVLAKAERGVAAARSDYIPDIGIVGTHVYQSSVPFIPRNSFGVGIQLEWTLIDFGKRSNTVGERRAQHAQAEANLQRVQSRVRGEVEKAYRKLARARLARELAREALEVRSEVDRLQQTQYAAGFILAAEQQQAEADRAEAEANLLRANLGYRIALAELQKAVGRIEP